MNEKLKREKRRFDKLSFERKFYESLDKQKLVDRCLSYSKDITIFHDELQKCRNKLKKEVV
jgi:hypothetical protein